jgi:hypothetical protein
MTKKHISMTEARNLIAKESNGKKNASDIKNPEILKSNKFKVISGPGSEADIKTTNWVLEVVK